MTNMIYRWYALCSTNVVTYRNWYTAVNGPMGSADPPNPNTYTDLADWCFDAERWWESLFSSHQALRHHSRSAAIAAGVAAPHTPGASRSGAAPSPQTTQGGSVRGGAGGMNNSTAPSSSTRRPNASPQHVGNRPAPHAPAPAGDTPADEVVVTVGAAAPTPKPAADSSRLVNSIGGGGGSANYLPHNAGAPSFKRVV